MSRLIQANLHRHVSSVKPSDEQTRLRPPFREERDGICEPVLPIFRCEAMDATEACETGR